MKSYPLQWPPGWRRARSRSAARFYSANGKSKAGNVGIGEAVKRVLHELHAFGVEEGDSIISSNLRTRLNGLPLASQPEPEDPGVAIYWKRPADEQHKVMALDRYDRVADNIAAIAATLEAMRRIERHGGAVILDRAFTGFLALPAPNTWRDVLQFYGEFTEPSLNEVKIRFRELSRAAHPDNGGTDAKMAELNWARSEAEKELVNG